MADTQKIKKFAKDAPECVFRVDWESGYRRNSRSSAVVAWSLAQKPSMKPSERIAERRKRRDAEEHEKLRAMAGGIAHYLNNILTGIGGHTSLLQMDLPEDSHLHESIEELQRTIAQASDFSSRLLAFSGRGLFDFRKLDLSDFIRHMAERFHFRMEKPIHLRFKLSDEPVLIQGGEPQVQMILSNLFANAVEAISESGTITFSTGIFDARREFLAEIYPYDDLAEGRYAYLEVSDDGMGMDEKTLSRIFDPFFSTKFTGRGLGLAAVLGVVRAHKGCVTARSRVGKGSVFTVFFPLAEALEKGADLSENTGLQHKTVLVVDDESTVRLIVKRTLEREGYRILTAENGLEGLKIFNKHQDEIDAVLLDLTMPEMDGEEALKQMHQIRADIPVLIISGFSDDTIARQFHDFPRLGFIQKPFHPADLIEKLSAELRNK